MTTSAQMLWAIAQQQPLAATTNLPTMVANTFGETMYLVNDDSIIEALPFPMATAPWSLKIGVLREIRLWRGLALTSPLRSRYCWTGTMKNNAAQLAKVVKFGFKDKLFFAYQKISILQHQKQNLECKLNKAVQIANQFKTYMIHQSGHWLSIYRKWFFCQRRFTFDVH
uniref:Uncharacterized protein n=1 Tax=Romanomermis culicivorax TaxID=13658 RepID=A0A915JAB4_ROMCU